MEDTSVDDSDPPPSCPANPGPDEDAGGMCGAYEEATIRGEVAIHPLTRRLDPTQNLCNGRLSLTAGVDYGTGNPTPLRTADCDRATRRIASNENVASFRFQNVEVTQLTEGIVGIVDDHPNGTGNEFARTATGLVESSDVPKSVTTENAWALSRPTTRALAARLDEPVGSFQDDGAIIGRAVDSGKDPVAGLRVAIGAPNPSLVSKAIYPDKRLDGTRNATSKNGYFVIPEAPLTDYVLIDENNDVVSSPRRGKSVPGSVFVLMLEYDGGS